MKVILLEDVKSLGKKCQLVDVSDGYARNFILSKKKGIEATAKNMNDLKLQKAMRINWQHSVWKKQNCLQLRLQKQRLFWN